MHLPSTGHHQRRLRGDHGFQAADGAKRAGHEEHAESADESVQKWVEVGEKKIF
jgi:hypothetical protein